MLDAIQIHYQPDMLGLATDNHEYGSVQLPPEEQVIFLWMEKQDDLGWYVWDGLLTVEESARALDDIGMVWMLPEEVAIG
jgi:hypothetical protein